MTVSLILGSAAASAASGQESEPAMQDQQTPAAVQQLKDNQEMASKSMDTFSKLDTNHDGLIDIKEAKADKSLAKEFKNIAKNGKLDKDGYGKWEQSHQKATKEKRG